MADETCPYGALKTVGSLAIRCCRNFIKESRKRQCYERARKGDVRCREGVTGRGGGGKGGRARGRRRSSGLRIQRPRCTTITMNTSMFWSGGYQLLFVFKANRNSATVLMMIRECFASEISKVCAARPGARARVRRRRAPSL